MRDQNKCHDQSIIFIYNNFISDVFGCNEKLSGTQQREHSEKQKEGKIIFIVGFEGWLKVERKIQKKLKINGK